MLRTEAREAAVPAMRRSIGRFQFFALGFGTIVGSAWVVVLGDWLHAAAPGGAVLAFIAGGLLMSLVAAVYAELSARMPEAGGEFIFAYRLFGEQVGFIVGWFVALYLIAVGAFEAIVLPWMMQRILPQLHGRVLYEMLGHQITLEAILIGGAGVCLVTWMNYRDVRLVVRFQSIITYGFLIVAVLVLTVGAASGELANLSPLFSAPTETKWWIGAFWIFANTAFFLNGFQTIPQAIEEKADGLSSGTIARVMMVCVAVAAIFYCLVIVCSSICVPWQQLAGEPLATATAVKHVAGGLLSRVVLLAAAFSLLKTWNATALVASRVLMAQARLGLLPMGFARIHPRFATPTVAVVFVGGCSFLGLALGRGGVLPLVNMASICLAFTYVLAAVALLKLRRQNVVAIGEFTVPGGTPLIVVGLLLAMGMACIALLQPWQDSGGRLPAEWKLMSGWALIGFMFFSLRRGLLGARSHRH